MDSSTRDRVNNMIRKAIKTYLYRILIHIPVGMVVPIIAKLNDMVALVFGLGFLIYEINEDVNHLKDGAYIDIQGFLIGIAAMSIFLLV